MKIIFYIITLFIPFVFSKSLFQKTESRLKKEMVSTSPMSYKKISEVYNGDDSLDDISKVPGFRHSNNLNIKQD